MAAALANGLIQPAFLAQFTFISGTEYVWTGIGDLVWGGKTFSGLGEHLAVRLAGAGRYATDDARARRGGKHGLGTGDEEHSARHIL